MQFRERDQKATRKERVMLDVDEHEDDDEIRDDGADKGKKCGLIVYRHTLYETRSARIGSNREADQVTLLQALKL